MELYRTAFVFLRHGETDWNKTGLSQGRTDVPLNEAGIAQAHAAAKHLLRTGIARIVASPLHRAQRTAEIVGQALNLVHSTEADLQEASFGDQEGKPMGPWYDDWVVGTYTPARAEPFSELQTRVVAAVNRAITPPGLTLIVAHGAMFRAARSAMGLSALVRTDNGVPLMCSPGDPWTLTTIG